MAQSRALLVCTPGEDVPVLASCGEVLKESGLGNSVFIQLCCKDQSVSLFGCLSLGFL